MTTHRNDKLAVLIDADNAQPTVTPYLEVKEVLAREGSGNMHLYVRFKPLAYCADRTSRRNSSALRVDRIGADLEPEPPPKAVIARRLGGAL